MPRLLPTVLAIFSLAGPASSAEVIRCTSAGHAPVTITLKSQRLKGRWLSCLSGDFVADLTPCAPDGGFALSAPTGTAGIVDVVDRWQQTMDHSGGAASFSQSVHALSFGGFFPTMPDYELSWTFDVDRLTGRGVLKQPKKVEVAFACAKATPKF